MNERQMRCDVCKAPLEQELLDFYVEIDGEQVLLEEVPTWVCTQCSNTFVEDDVIEAVEDLLDHMDDVAEDTDELET